MADYKILDNEFAIVHIAQRDDIKVLKEALSDLENDIALLSINIHSSNHHCSCEKNGIYEYNPEISIAFPEYSWEYALRDSSLILNNTGINTSDLSTIMLVSKEELETIQNNLCRPIYERLSWDQWDYIFSFGIGIAAGALDIFLGTPGHGLQKQLADTNTWIGSQMDKIHKLHPSGAPIDYTGEHFGGPFHRGRTTGHDLLRPLEGIRQFKDGKFIGFYWAYGEKISLESLSNEYGIPYDSMSWGHAVQEWMIHMFCDFFSAVSLPIPGTSLLQEVGIHKLRKFIQEDLYKRGINLRHLVLQAIPPLFIEITIRLYLYLRYHNHTLDTVSLDQKKHELLTASHGISTAFNIGKIVIMEDPTLINIPQLSLLLKYIYKLTVLESNRTAYSSKVRRNLNEIRLVNESLLSKRMENIVTL